MRIKTVHLLRYKRFTDLTISKIPETAKLVIIVGPNGSGKTSLFDAFLNWHRWKTQLPINHDPVYHNKYPGENFQPQNIEVVMYETAPVEKNSMYIRTAYRNDSDFTSSRIRPPQNPAEAPRFNRLIDEDKTVSQNYEKLIYDAANAVYNKNNDSKSVKTLREDLIGQIQKSIKRVFDDLELTDITNIFGSAPGAGAFHFKKGESLSYHYKNLSGGEKAAFDLILDMYLKRKDFPDAIYCIDEIESHLHTRIQGILLQELVKIIPGRSQLWVATHSLGILRAAQIIEKDCPGSVCVIDFSTVSHDVKYHLFPTTLDKTAWEKMLSITLDDLSKQIAPEIMIICEGSSSGKRRKDFDAEIYNKILGDHMPNVVFVSGGSAYQVEQNGNMLREILRSILPQTKIISLIDRDDMTDEKVQTMESKRNTIVLQKRNLESYLFSDDVLKAFVKKEEKSDLYERVLQLRSDALSDSSERGNQSDDLKSAAGSIYIELKKLMDLNQQGNNADEFMMYTLAPLIKPGMYTYENLKSAILDRIICQ